MALSFSTNGMYLAAGCCDGMSYPINVYDILNGVKIMALNGHQDIVYDITWSPDDRQLLSSSSDGSARVWDFGSVPTAETSASLNHPVFVYAARFHPACTKPRIIATGAYDGVVRVFLYDSDRHRLDADAQGWHRNRWAHESKLRDLPGHDATVNALAFDLDGGRMYTGDGKGVIRVWSTEWDVQEKGAKSRHEAYRTWVNKWGLIKAVREPDLRDNAINHIQVHPSGRSMLVSARHHNVCLVDFRFLHTISKCEGVLNDTKLIKGCISPCGTLIFSPSEDGKMYGWSHLQPV